MSYNRKQLANNAAPVLTDNDMSTLKLLWGEEDDNNTSRNQRGGNFFSEKLNYENKVYLKDLDNKQNTKNEYDYFTNRRISESWEGENLFNNIEKADSQITKSIFEENFIKEKQINANNKNSYISSYYLENELVNEIIYSKHITKLDQTKNYSYNPKVLLENNDVFQEKNDYLI